MICYGVVNVLNLLFILVVSNDIDFIDWYIVGYDIFFYMLGCFIRRGIINIDDAIVGIILHEDGVEVS